MEYKIVKETNLSIFIHNVESLLKYGWKLHGGVSITSSEMNGVTIWYAQALTKE